MQVFDGRPLCKTQVASPGHAYLSIAPRLFTDPVDDVIRITGVMFKGLNFLWTTPLSPGTRYHSCISCLRIALGPTYIGGEIVINIKKKDSRQFFFLFFLSSPHRLYRASIVCGDQFFLN